MPHHTLKVASRRVTTRFTEHQGTGQRKALRPSPISEACGSRLATRTCRSGFTFDKPEALRGSTLIRY